LYLQENFQYSGCTYKKNGYPGETDVVERNRSLERVIWRRFALSIVLVPVDTGLSCGRAAGTSDSTVVAQHAPVFVRWQIGALVHAVVLRLGADVVSVLLHVGVVRGEWSAGNTEFVEDFVISLLRKERVASQKVQLMSFARQ
jgi:hypothetical protein